MTDQGDTGAHAVCASLYRGQDCRTCSGVCGPVSHGLCGLWACLTWALWFVGLSHMGSGVCGPVLHGSGVCGPVLHGPWGLWACLTWALGVVGLPCMGFVGLSHMGSGGCGPTLHGLWGVGVCLTWAVDLCV